MNEKEIQLEIAKLKTQFEKDGKKLTAAHVANHFNQSPFWAYSRTNYLYMTKKVKDALRNGCPAKFRVPFEISEFTGTAYCSRCRNTMRDDHFITQKPESGPKRTAKAAGKSAGKLTSLNSSPKARGCG